MGYSSAAAYYIFFILVIFSVIQLCLKEKPKKNLKKKPKSKKNLKEKPKRNLKKTLELMKKTILHLILIFFALITLIPVVDVHH